MILPPAPGPAPAGRPLLDSLQHALLCATSPEPLWVEVLVRAVSVTLAAALCGAFR